MFTCSPQKLLDALDDIVGSREQTRDVIAMASAAVLTASPHGREADWLREVQRSIACRPASSEIVLSVGAGDSTDVGGSRLRDQTREPEDQERRARALRHLLDTLAAQHGQNAPATLKHLSVLAAHALASSQPGHFRRWSQFLLRAHRIVQDSYLAANPDLN